MKTLEPNRPFADREQSATKTMETGQGPGSELRIAIGQVFHEGNSFNLRLTERVDFSVLKGEEIVSASSGEGTSLAGILAELTAPEFKVCPTIAAFTSPGGPVLHSVWEELRDELVERIVSASPHVVLLDLHGAMITDECGDPEGELLEALRQRLGNEVIIGASLDLHAHVTDKMCRNANALVACKNNPHDDYFEAGQKVARICLDASRRNLRLTLSRARIPMILYGNDETSHGPLLDINRVARALEVRPVLDVSIFNVQAFLDVPGVAQVVTVLSEDDGSSGREACSEIASLLLERAPEFRTDHLPIAELWSRLEKRDGRLPFAVSDFGDRVLGGSAGDGTQILHETLKRPHVKAAIPVTDPEAVSRLADKDVGDRAKISVGGAFCDDEPADLDAVVEKHHPGTFTLTGQWRRGEVADHGRTVVLKVQAAYVIVTERPAYSQDANFFESLGLDISTLDFVVCKSGFHFKLSFEDRATPLVLGTAGVTEYDPARTDLKRPRIWPEIQEAPTTSSVELLSFGAEAVHS